MLIASILLHFAGTSLLTVFTWKAPSVWRALLGRAVLRSSFTCRTWMHSLIQYQSMWREDQST